MIVANMKSTKGGGKGEEIVPICKGGKCRNLQSYTPTLELCTTVKAPSATTVYVTAMPYEPCQVVRANETWWEIVI